MVDKWSGNGYNNICWLSLSSKCECAGTGRQARLRGVCRMTYGFKSRHSHHSSLTGKTK